MSHLLLSKKSLYIAIMATGMICTYNISMAYADQSENKPAINIGEVNGQSSTAEKNKKDNKKVDLKSPVQTVHITQRDIEDNTPSGGSMAEAIAATTPGFQARRTGTASGANRYQIRLNGIQIGFDETGQAEMNGNQILMDGIPLNNPLASYHGFSTAELPISSMFSGINVVYGPGTAKQHWFDSMGGTIDFRTKSSGENPSAFVDIGAGSFNAYNASTGISTGSIDGWKTYIAG
ncbi:TonB-dependent receptor plug domain-containing protein [Acidithiobacillus thiooxidans]|uniref:TonB-dependent receptor plug domain-containing protein n=1 Tax=Acidithiobacillus thiooxidans TaxID=930 RepID=UPI001C07040C|nr:TonB-dependent receptor plug domain-containing protein [Acidithiobacillus thiooxidans]MBU2844052.1 TonB-dependent receptor plug domain-containing protein [Acidithiobacillus thiooxidans]